MAAGVQEIRDPTSTSPLGIGEATESRIGGSRLIASEAYSLTGVHVITESMVRRILLDEKVDRKRAIGVELINGRIFFARREVILSAGAYRTPQILLLSGIGPAEELARHDIVQLVDAPCVGKNLFGHMGLKQYWKLRHPEIGAAVGSPYWIDPAFHTGNPVDYVVCHSVPHEGLKHALALDEPGITNEHPLLEPLRCHVETIMQYAGANKADPAIALDGTHTFSLVMGMLPTSRGSVTLQSKDPTENPLIDPNYYATRADRYVIREGVRKFMEVVHDTPGGQEMIACETVPDGLPALCPSSTDKDIDVRVAQSGQ